MEDNSGPFRSDKPASVLKANYTKIELLSNDDNGASIRITSTLQKRCLFGYVWREATADDYVCVTISTRSATKIDNLNQLSRKDLFGNCNAPWVKR